MGHDLARWRTLYYPRHFALLVGFAAALVSTRSWRPALGPVASLGLYGLLHGLSVILSLRVAGSFLRKLAFVAAASALSMSVWTAMSTSKLLGFLPGATSPALLLGLCSGLGAAAYGMLIRLFWIGSLPGRALVSMTLCSVGATLAALSIEGLMNSVGGLWLALAWWFGFSAALGYHDAGREPGHDPPNEVR